MKAAAPHVPPYCLDERLRDLSFETDQTMIDDVQTKTHVVCADAASDEQLCMKILSGRRFVCEEDWRVAAEPVLRRVLIRLRERAYASRRILSHSWEADECLKRVAGILVLNKNRLVARIRNSHTFSARYHSYVQDMERVVDGASDSSPKDLGYAPHRLDSTAKPFARCVLFCLALSQPAQSILNERGPRSEVGADMVAFLVAFDVEFALTMAALADSGDEGLVVTRFFDVELFCKTLAREQLHRFMANMTYLFRHRGALNIEHSYFNYMVQVLEKHEIIIHVENKVRRVGGPGAVTADIFDRVFGRMAAWVDLALHVAPAPGQFNALVIKPKEWLLL